ncbi:MAG TPA: non-homologous end-joining DNA ligase [Microbacteriaceae bacterium]|nr:non-homologous end-joining DNA ligase [Microbacteriaceae bacterium]
MELTNPGKVMYPATGTTKADVLEYYLGIAEYLLPYAAGRPVTRKRWVDGVAHPPFFQKNIERFAPDWVPTRIMHHKDHDNWYPVLDAETGVATLGWFAQVAALELHVPQWRFAPDGTPGHPDRMVFDLDPGEGTGLAECVQVAKLIRDRLGAEGFVTVPVTSGGKGIHVYAALDGSRTSDEANEFAHELARALEEEHPALVVSTIRKADRRGKVLIDWSQNNASKTTITPYSLRGRTRPTVAMPRTWGEITSGRLRQIEFDEVLPMLRRRGDAAEALRPAQPPL